MINVGWNFDHSYARLPDALFARVSPEPVRDPRVVILNHALCETLGLDFKTIDPQEIAKMCSGNTVTENMQPLAQAYAGHQYGNFNKLGDGRAILLGEHITNTGERVDIQLKGSGRTPFSRRGDGRAALAPMLREYIMSEAMYALKIPTTRSLAVVTTGERVQREKAEHGAILTRIAASHIRVGTFEYVAALAQPHLLKTLADYTIARHYAEIEMQNAPYQAFLNSVMESQAALVASWMQVGFIHGVMNTDNVSIAGETIDYGPCAFMDHYDPSTVFSAIDAHGRYAYAQQPKITQWNMARFAQAIAPLLHDDYHEAMMIAQKSIETFPSLFSKHFMQKMRHKLGLLNVETDDHMLIDDLLSIMHHHHADFTNTFRALEKCYENDMSHVGDLSTDRAFLLWLERWKARLKRQQQSTDTLFVVMRSNNPAIIPRNHRVQEALAALSEQGDDVPMLNLLNALAKPFDDVSAYDAYRETPTPSQRVYQTFCGT